MTVFEIGQKYSRKDVISVVGIEDPGGGPWYTGSVRHNDDWFIFCGLGVPGRTGHKYDNQLLGEELVWYGPTNSKFNWPSMDHLMNQSHQVHIFYRRDNTGDFTYAGIGHVKEYEDVIPVRIVWDLTRSGYRDPTILPEETTDAEGLYEGGKVRIIINAYERNRLGRQRCLDHWGFACTVCGITLEEVYGEIAREYIHVHHLKPLHEVSKRYKLDPVEDLRPVCPNCHAIIHRKVPALSITEIKQIMTKAQG